MNRFITMNILIAIFGTSLYGMEHAPDTTSAEYTLTTLKATAPEKVFIRALPMSKRESQGTIVERLATLPSAITIDNKEGTVALEGPLIKIFIQNGAPTTQIRVLEGAATGTKEKGPVTASDTTSIDYKLNRLKAAAPNKVHIPLLPNASKAVKLALMQRLLALPNAITLDHKKAIVVIEGPTIEAFVQSTQTAQATDNEKLDLRWEFAKISHLLQTPGKDIKTTGIPKEIQIDPAQLQQAFLTAIQAVSLEYTENDKNPTVSLDMSKLLPLLQLMHK